MDPNHVTQNRKRLLDLLAVQPDAAFHWLLVELTTRVYPEWGGTPEDRASIRAVQEEAHWILDVYGEHRT